METKQYSNLELKAFETELLPYWETRTPIKGEPIKICNYTNYMRDRKIMRYYSDSKDWAIAGDKLKEYVETQAKIHQLSLLKGRRNFAKQKEVETIEEMGELFD